MSPTAFEHDIQGEVARILRSWCDKITSRIDEAVFDDFPTLRDLNGNTCGTVTVTP